MADDNQREQVNNMPIGEMFGNSIAGAPVSHNNGNVVHGGVGSSAVASAPNSKPPAVPNGIGSSQISKPPVPPKK